MESWDDGWDFAESDDSGEEFPAWEDSGDPWPPSPPPQPQRQKSRTPLVIGIAAAVVVVAIICVVAVIFLVQSGLLPFLQTQQAAPKIMPAEMTGYAAVNVDIRDMPGLQHLSEVYGDLGEFEDGMDDFQMELEDEFGITFEDDIQPWLGSEVAVGFSELDRTIEDEEVNMVLAVATKNTKLSDEFLDTVIDILEDEDYDVDEEIYQKVSYYAADPSSEWETPLYFSTVKDFVVLTTDDNTMEDVIDASKGKIDSLAKNDRYKDLSAALPGDAVAYMFLDMQDLMKDGLDAAEEGLAYEGIELPREFKEQVEALQAAGLALRLDDEGIQVDVAVTFDPDALSPELLEGYQSRASANRILDRVPDDALAFYSGQDLASMWRSAFRGLGTVPDAEQQLEDLTDVLGLRIDEDFLSWMSGEYALAVVEAYSTEDTPVCGFGLFEVDDQVAAEDTFDQVTDVLEEAGGVEFDDMTVDGVDLKVLYDPWSEEIIVGYGFDDGILLIGVPGEGVERATETNITPITDDTTFKAVRSHLPGKTTGYLYVNIEDTMDMAYDNMGDWEQEDYDEEIRPYVEPIKALGFAASPADLDKGVSHVTFFAYIP